MSTYGLLEHFEDISNPEMVKHHEPYTGKSDKYLNKYLFKDKKLNKLWEKAESAGFTGITSFYFFIMIYIILFFVCVKHKNFFLPIKVKYF